MDGLGNCPVCGLPSVGCNREPDGDTWCENRHYYKHTDRIYLEHSGIGCKPKPFTKIKDRTDPIRKNRTGGDNPYSSADPEHSIRHERRNSDSKKEADKIRSPEKVQPIESSVRNSLEFIVDNVEKTVDQISESLKSFEYPETVRELASHLIFTNMSGWSEKDGKFIHESGREAYKDNWVLSEDGRLKTKGNSMHINTDKLYKFIEACCDGGCCGQERAEG